MLYEVITLPVTAFRAHRVRKPDASPSSVPRYLLEAELDAGGRRLVRNNFV